jgi:hypothetical protein
MAVRLDPYQNIVNVSWSNGVGVPAYVIFLYIAVKRGQTIYDYSGAQGPCGPTYTYPPPVGDWANSYATLQEYGYTISGGSTSASPPDPVVASIVPSYLENGKIGPNVGISLTGRPVIADGSYSPGAVNTPGSRFQSVSGSPLHPRANPTEMPNSVLGPMGFKNTTSLTIETGHKAETGPLAPCFGDPGNNGIPNLGTKVVGVNTGFDISDVGTWAWGAPSAVDVSGITATITHVTPSGTETYNLICTGAKVLEITTAINVAAYATLLLEREDLT